MKYLIVLRGASSQGKSCTLNRLRKLFDEDSRYVVQCTPHPDGYDTSAIVAGADGKKIGIITFGDSGTEDHIAGLLAEMNDAGVSIIFAASRPRGRVWDLLNEFATSKDYDMIATSSLHSEDNQDVGLVATLNGFMAGMLKSLVEKL